MGMRDSGQSKRAQDEWILQGESELVIASKYSE